MSPFVVCQFGGKTGTGTCKNWQGLNGMLLTLKADKAARDETGQCYRRQKPVELYKSLVVRYGAAHSWVMDFCSGAGTVGKSRG